MAVQPFFALCIPVPESGAFLLCLTSTIIAGLLPHQVMLPKF